MGKFDKQLKYSIRKVSVGAASVVIGAFYLAMGAGVVHAETNTTTDGGASHASPSPDRETSRRDSLPSPSYGAESAQNPGVSGNSTDPETAPKEKENNDTLATNNTKPVENKETVNTAQPTGDTTSTRSRRSKRDVGDAPASGTANTSTGTSTGNNGALNSAVTERKGATVQPDQPGVNIPKGDEPGAHDPNAHLTFNLPEGNVTVEEMWKIIQNMPDDFQNNERSYLRNMDTLGDELRFDKNGNVTTDPSGVKLQPGEIREISSFGGWTAIMKKDGTTGKFAIGMKNEQGYFTGWYTDKDGKRQEGGMLGSNALDQIYLHEQALDRRFKYMLMLAKGRTIANKTDKAQDHSDFDIKTANSDENKADLAKLPVKEREDILQHAPNIEGFNGIEKTFTAFSTAYGSRLKIEFVTGYISDFAGSKGTYRIVVKAIKKDKSEETVYDHTINRIDGVVENEERYSQGVDLTAVNKKIKDLLKTEYNYKVNTLATERYKEKYERGKIDRDKLNEIKSDIEKELAKNGEAIVELPIDKDKLNEKKFKNETKFKESFTRYGNELNTILKKIPDANLKQNSPIWDTTNEKNSDGSVKSKDPDRVYKLLDFILPTAKKIVYHADTDQLELVTDPAKVKTHREELNTRLAAKKAELNTANEAKKIELNKEISALESAIRSTNDYTYKEARNGKEAKILGSHMEASVKPDKSELTDDEYEKIRTNELALEAKDGLKKFTNYFVEKERVNRSHVLPDAELSKKITEAIDGDEDKLGKGGYFSTGDIPLGKDVVSYKVQVFAENEKRVGVNMQSPRLQYNLPILADFSVIQDTVEPSKEVARRIITKLKEKGKITEEQEKKIKEEIEKSKKTSELKSAMSGDVTVRYVDTDGNNLPITDADAKKAGEKTDNGYLVRKDVLIGTDYDVNSKKVPSFKATNGKNYALRSVGGGLETSSDAPNGSITKKNTVITFVYEERTVPPTGKGVVRFKKQVSETTTEALNGYPDISLEGDVGTDFSGDSVNAKITELKNAGYEIVTNEFDTNSKTIDSVTDTDGQDPSQVYNVIVREKVETVTTPPTPNTPVDPTVPDGPKWPETGLKESDLTKEVTRTINYFKKETADGEKIPNAKPTKVDKVLYKRTATYNLVSKTVTYGKWIATADDTHTATSFSSVKTPVLTGYVADFKEVTDAPAAPNENGEVTNMTKEVVYTKIGSWVPKIPGKTPTPIPYPNDPKDPTKPKDPEYPQPGQPITPGTPVIPYVPGYTPKIGETPLQPVDPNHPENGYKVPPVPETPGTNTDITYAADPQKAVVKVFNTTTGTEVELPAEKVSIDNGTTDSAIPTNSVTTKIADLEKRGYVVENKDLLNNQKFDNQKDPTDGDPTQVFNLKVHEKLVPVTPPTEDKPITPGTPIDPDAPVDPKNPNDPLIPTWTEDLINKVKNAETTKEVTRTINYVDEAGAKVTYIANGKETTESKTDKVTFTREAKINVVTGNIVYGNWTAKDNDTTFEAVTSPVVKGYILKANQDTQNGLVSTDGTSVVESTNLTATSANQNVNVVYTKLGSWVLTPPTGVTPPTGTNFDPKPYPNHPTDPTKPTDPEYPQPGTPVEPNTPVIPYVPGYTPKTPDGNPLVPVDPNHPENGYKVPPVPTTPGKDTPITYVADPQKAVVKVFNTTTGTEVELPAEKVSIDNGTTDSAIPTNSVTTKIADLEKRGYVVENKDLLNNQKFDNQKDPTDGDPTQVFNLKVHEKLVPVTPPTEDKPITPGTPIDPDAPVDPKNPNDPLIPTWTEDLINKVKNAETTKEVTRTINYVDEAGAKVTYIANGKETTESKTDKVTFTREAKINVVTGNIVYGNWTAKDNDTTFEAVTSPVVKGYILKANQDTQNGLVSTDGTSVVESTNLTATSANQNVNVVYTKLGSWVLTPPTGVTPPTGTNFDPKPYPNHPTDPTKPTDPEYPQPGTPVEPNTPVIPYVPGYTPKTPDGNPLVPVDPNHPENGYKVPPVPTTPGKDTPITYEKVPDKPKPETTGTKEVTRTIKYVDEKGNELAKPSTDKVTFTRNGSDWNAVGGDSTFDAVKSPVVKGYILKDPAQKVVEKETVKSDAKDETITVTYTKVGSFVPKVPEGVTPKTPLTPTPYDNDPEDPTKVVTPNPEKPQDPKDPNSPKVPVIPQVPGHTPVVPKDPTKPVSPENPLVPLTPVDPNHPEKGYNVPPVPTIPGQDTPITYVKDGQQKAITSFVDPKGNVLETPITETGDSNTPLTKDGEIKATIAKLKLKGYDVETNTYPPKGTFDNDPKVDQYFKVTLTPRVKPVKPFDPTDPKDPNKPVPGQPIDPDTPVDPNNPNDPTIPRWTEDLINKLETTKQVTRTINYVDEAGNKVSEKSTDKVTFTREAKINVVTGEITYGDWNAVGGDSTFDKVPSPVVKGYILKDPAQKEVAERKGITPTVANQTIEVVYKKLGSWVPKVPGVETPTPLPYPNNPTDPTKPGEPTDPNVPVIPYVPGYTPKTPDGNPLVPKVPNDPTQGYIPPVPTEPGQDTPIEYVKVPNTPSPEEPVKPTPESNHITIWVDENGKPLKPEKPGTHEPGNIPGYRYITTVTKDGVTIHKFEKITPVEPNNPVPQKPTTPIPTPQDPTIPTPESQIPTPNTPEANTPTSETNRREELPNTGTEANASLASAGIITLLAGLGLGFFKKKEEDEK